MSNPALWPTWPPNTWCLLLMSSIRFDYLQYKVIPKVVLCYCAAARKESNIVIKNERIYHTHIDNVIKEGLPITNSLAKNIMVGKKLIRLIDSTHEAVVHFNWHRPGNVQCCHLSSFSINDLSLDTSLTVSWVGSCHYCDNSFIPPARVHNWGLGITNVIACTTSDRTLIQSFFENDDITWDPVSMVKGVV